MKMCMYSDPVVVCGSGPHDKPKSQTSCVQRMLDRSVVASEVVGECLIVVALFLYVQVWRRSV